MNKKPSRTNIIVVIAFTLIFLAYFELFGEYGPLFYLIHTPPLLILIPPFLYFVFKVYQRKSYILPFACLLVMLITLTFGVGRKPVLSATINTEGRTTLRVCSWNTAYFFKWGKEEGLKRLAETNCDFILLQEIWRANEETTEIEEAQRQYLQQYTAYANAEFVIFTPKEATANPIISNNSGYYGLETTYKGVPLTLLSVHLWNPITPRPTYQNGVIVPIPADVARADQKAELLREIKRTADKVNANLLVVGDFNTMQNGKVLRDIKNVSNRKLEYLSVPLWQNRNTYSTSLRLIQIDYAFLTDKSFSQSRIQTSCDVKASDHCLLIIDLVL